MGILDELKALEDRLRGIKAAPGDANQHFARRKALEKKKPDKEGDDD